MIANTATVTWIVAPPKLTTTAVTGQFFTNDGSGAFNTPKTQQALFTETFPNINFNPVSTLTRPFTDIVTDPSGNTMGSIVAQGPNYQAGVSTLYNFSAVFTGSLNVPSAGPVTFTFAADDAFIFAVGNAASRFRRSFAPKKKMSASWPSWSSSTNAMKNSRRKSGSTPNS